MKYFETRVHARSPEELEKRVADNKKRGFEVVRYFERKSNSNTNVTSGSYLTHDGKVRRDGITDPYHSYGAVMRRENRDKAQ